MVRQNGPLLQDVRLRFGVTLSCPEQANAFAQSLPSGVPRSSSTVLEDTAWFIFRCGAIDGHDASIQAAVAVKTIAAHKLVREQPRSSLFHDVEVSAPVPAHELKRAAHDREDALAKAMRWALHHPSRRSAPRVPQFRRPSRVPRARARPAARSEGMRPPACRAPQPPRAVV